MQSPRSLPKAKRIDRFFDKEWPIVTAGIITFLAYLLGCIYFFIAGIIDIVDALKLDDIPAQSIAWGICEIVFCETISFIVAIPVFVIAYIPLGILGLILRRK